MIKDHGGARAYKFHPPVAVQFFPGPPGALPGWESYQTTQPVPLTPQILDLLVLRPCSRLIPFFFFTSAASFLTADSSTKQVEMIHRLKGF